MLNGLRSAATSPSQLRIDRRLLRRPRFARRAARAVRWQRLPVDELALGEFDVAETAGLALAAAHDGHGVATPEFLPSGRQVRFERAHDQGRNLLAPECDG